MDTYALSNTQTTSLVVGCLGFFLVLYLIWVKNRRISTNDSEGLPLPPGTFGFLGVGETFKYFYYLSLGLPSKFLQERTTIFLSKTFKTRVFFHNTVVVQGVNANRFIAAAENKEQLLNSWPGSLIEVFGKHIPIVQQGSVHRHMRQIMTSCLAPVALQKLVGQADLITNLHFDTCWKPPSEVLLLSLIRQNYFRIVCALLAGVEDEAHIARIYEYFKIWANGMMSLPLNIPGTSFRRAKNAKQVLAQEIGKLLDGRKHMSAKHQLEEKNVNVLYLLQRSRDDKGRFLDREELLDVILFLMFAAFDTPTAALTFVLKYLEQHPACYHRLLQEHEAIASQKNPRERLTWADIQNMKYTWTIIQETLRLRPIGIGGFKLVQQDLSFDGYKIPKGWKVFFNMSPTHEDQQFFQEPHQFDPSRFHIEQEGNGIPPYVYVPFGIGPHSCLGGDFSRMTMSIYLHHLALKKVRWTSIDPNEKVRALPTLRLSKSYPAKIFID